MAILAMLADTGKMPVPPDFRLSFLDNSFIRDEKRFPYQLLVADKTNPWCSPSTPR